MDEFEFEIVYTNRPWPHRTNEASHVVRTFTATEREAANVAYAYAFTHCERIFGLNEVKDRLTMTDTGGWFSSGNVLLKYSAQRA
jgi:hypothetical protein